MEKKLEGYIDSKVDTSFQSSDIMKVLEDIDYDITQVDIDSLSIEELDSEHIKSIERDAELQSKSFCH